MAKLWQRCILFVWAMVQWGAAAVLAEESGDVETRQEAVGAIVVVFGMAALCIVTCWGQPGGDGPPPRIFHFHPRAMEWDANDDTDDE